MKGYDQILYLSDLIATNGEVLSNIPQWPDSTKWRVWIKYCSSVTWYYQMERYDQILYLIDLIVPAQILYLSDLIANGEVWSNIVPQWSDSTKWRGMVKYCSSVNWYYQMGRYDQILYLSDLRPPNGEVWSNIIPQWPDSTKWRGIKYCTSVTW